MIWGGLFSRLKGWIVLAGGILAAIALAFARGYGAGRNRANEALAKQRAQSQEERLEMHRRADAIEDEVQKLDRAKLEAEAGKWSKR
jgi:uncharacterized membrane protein YdjX (TVP38/TMEM64 family)